MEKEKEIDLIKSFQSCSFDARKRSKSEAKSHDGDSSTESDQFTSFFVDSSGRSSFTAHLRMSFQEKHGLEQLLAAGCFDPPPKSDDDATNDQSAAASAPTMKRNTDAYVSFEVESIPSEYDDTRRVTVEGVSIVSSSIKDSSVTFKTKVTMRASKPGSSHSSPKQMSPSRFSSSPVKNNAMKDRIGDSFESDQEDQQQQVTISTRFAITPVLIIENNRIKNEVSKNNFRPDLMQLELVAIPDEMQYNNKKDSSSVLGSSNEKINETRLSPVTISVTLTNAFAIAVKSVPGPKSRVGNTLVSLSIQHSNTHNLPVTITNICVHPGHSRHTITVAPSNKKTVSNKNEGPSKVQQAICKYHDAFKDFYSKTIHNNDRCTYDVCLIILFLSFRLVTYSLAIEIFMGRSNLSKPVNMTESVEWGYMPNTELKLPLTINPHEAYSSIIFINAGEERNSRRFVSPLSVTGVVSEEDSTKTISDNTTDNDHPEQHRVVVAGDVFWNTKPIAVEPADSFRIDMCTFEPTVQRGEPMVIKLRIFNLSLDSRNLMIFVAKKDRSSSSNDPSVAMKEESVNAAVVSESEGYTFGVWGISGDDDGTVRLNRDHELLAIDTALVLGEIQGQHAVDAELRFIPLRLGRLKVPDWKLYDKIANRWYNCTHDLNIVAVEANGSIGSPP